MKIFSIQYLRAAAALMVVLFHIVNQLRRLGYSGGWPSSLAAGVDVFFIISGFIMWATTYQGQLSPLEFYRRRVVRIVPTYWLLTSFLLAVFLVEPQFLQSARFDGHHVVASYLFLPVEHPATHKMEPFLIPVWTLNYEMFFYLIFGLALLLPIYLRLAAILSVLVGLVILGGALVDLSPISSFSFYCSNIILEFGMGLLLGWLYTSGRRLPVWVSIALVMVGTVLLMFTSRFYGALPRVLIGGVPALCIVTGALFFERSRRVPEFRIVHLLGDASYSIYLSHGIVLSALGQGWRHWAPEWGGTIFFSVAGLVISSVAGIAFYFLIEKPMIRIFDRRKKKSAIPVIA